MTKWRQWVAFWDEKELPHSIALVRIFVGLCLLYDMVHIWHLGLVVPLFGAQDVGGLSAAHLASNPVWFYEWMPPTAFSARLLHAALLMAALTLTIGFFSRFSALVCLLCWVAFAFVAPFSDRGIDSLSRMLLTILVFAPCGASLSIDARLRFKRWWGNGELVPAWARKLFVLQLVWMYFSAGTLKVGVTWWPHGDFAALYYALLDPGVSAFDFGWMYHTPIAFFFTQVGTAMTMLYQLTYPFVLLIFWWKRNPDRGGRIAALTRRFPVEWFWIGTGALFHVILGIVMNLGIFPWMMLAVYPAMFDPQSWRRLGSRLQETVV